MRERRHCDYLRTRQFQPSSPSAAAAAAAAAADDDACVETAVAAAAAAGSGRRQLQLTAEQSADPAATLCV